jgi:hypothetical protein
MAGRLRSTGSARTPRLRSATSCGTRAVGLLQRRRSRAVAVGWTTLLFGPSHALPTLNHHDGNPASGLLTDPRQGRRSAGTMLSTAGAGWVFAWLRLRSGGLVAPILALANPSAPPRHVHHGVGQGLLLEVA